MLDKIKKDITDSDIDELFNNDNNSIVLNNNDNNIIPEELSIKNKNKTNHIDRPKESISEQKRIKYEYENNIEDIDKKIDENVIDVKSVKNLTQLKKFISKILNYRQSEQLKKTINDNIINGVTECNIDNSTQCNFHIYQPQHIMGDSIYCKCKYCSTMKIFSQIEWDDYCIKYRKWF